MLGTDSETRSVTIVDIKANDSHKLLGQLVENGDLLKFRLFMDSIYKSNKPIVGVEEEGGINSRNQPMHILPGFNQGSS